MKKLLLLLLILAPNLAQAADERAYEDVNRHPTLLVVDSVSGEIRRLTSDASGAVFVVAKTTGTNNVLTSTAAVTGVTAVLPADAARQSSLVCNEGPEVARVGPAATLTINVGHRLLVDTCVSLDAPSAPFQGALSAISVTGSPTKMTSTEAK